MKLTALMVFQYSDGDSSFAIIANTVEISVLLT